MQALVWLPDPLGAALAEALQGILQEQASAWQLCAPSAVQATLLSAGGEPKEAPLPADSMDLLQWESATWRIWLAEQVMGAPWAESAVVDSAMRQLLQSLGQRLQHSFGAAPTGGDAPACRALPGHRGVRLQLSWQGRPMHLTLGIAQLQASGWLKPVNRARLAAVDLASALASTPVPLQVTLGTIDLQIADWLHLAPGDVLLLDKPLNEPLTVQVPGSDWRQFAQLGSNAQQTHRALRWVAD